MIKNVLILLEEVYQGKHYLVVPENQAEEILIEHCGNLAKDVNTDQIFPPRFLPLYDNMAPAALAGFQEIGENFVKEQEIETVIAGTNFGLGSSRIQAVRDLLDAGIKLVLAESFYPIYRTNALNCCLAVSQDLSLTKKIAKQEIITARDLKLTTQETLITSQGGLITCLKNMEKQGITAQDYNQKLALNASKRPQTLPEKYFARLAQLPAVKPGWQFLGDFQKALIGSYELYSPLTKKAFEANSDDRQLKQPKDFIATSCHVNLITPYEKEVAQIWRNFAEPLGCHYYAPNHGVCHSLISDEYAQPGRPVFFTDSHTPHAGWLTYAQSMGVDDLVALMLTRKNFLTVPATVKVKLKGKLEAGATIRDLAMKLMTQKWPENCVLEYHDLSENGLTREEMMILCNIAVELRITSAIFKPNQTVRTYLKTIRNWSQEEIDQELIEPDENAIYLEEKEFDLKEIKPVFALPPAPQNVHNCLDYLQREASLQVNKVWLGSCVGGGLEELTKAIHIILKYGLSPKVETFIQPNSVKVYKILKQQYPQLWLFPGLKILLPACGACMGGGEGAAKSGDIMFSTATRNFAGRNAAGTQIYLASNSLCALIATTGEFSLKTLDLLKKQC